MTDTKEYTEEEIRNSFNSGYALGMEQGEKLGRKNTIHKMLEIIDAERDSVTNTMTIDEEYVSVYTILKDIRLAVEALNGSEQR